MKRTTWTVMLSAVALITVGCMKVETGNTPNPANDTQPAAATGPAFPEQPPGPETLQTPVEDEGNGSRKQGVAGAIGKALLKGIGGGSDSPEDPPDEALPFSQ